MRSPFHPKQTLRGVTLNGPIRFPHTPFQCPRSRTATLELGAAALTCPSYALLNIEPFVRRSTTGTEPIATREPSSRRITALDRVARAFSVSPHPGADGLVRVSCRPSHLNVDRFGRIPGEVRTVIPVPRGDHLPLRAARSSLRASHWRFSTPTGRYHGRMLIRPSLPCMYQPNRKKRCSHAGKFGILAGAACSGHALGTPSPWPCRFSFVKLIARMPIHTAIACKYPSNNICTVVEEWHQGYFCLQYFFSSTNFDLMRRTARKVWRHCGLVLVHDRQSHAGKRQSSTFDS